MAKHGNQSLGMLTGLAIGSGLMYLLDPDRGNRRRKLVRDKMIHGLHVAGDSADKSVRDLRNRARGTVAETWSVLRHEEVSDEILEQRVRAKLGRAVSHPNSIEVKAHNGTVTLSGPILEHEVDGLLSSIWSVHGVRDVENRLEPHKQAGDIPGLQGGHPVRGGQRFELLQENWAPGTRALVGIGGIAFMAAAPRRGGWLLRSTGLAMLLRAITNLSFRRLFGLGETRAGIRLQKTIEIKAPLERVYEFWSNPENWSKFMAHVREVRKSGDGLYHWTVSGPAGISVSFNSEITQRVPNQVLAWKSLPGEMIRNAGIVRFQQSGEGTRLHILMSYNPPGGVLGHVVAALFGTDPKHALEQDMVRLKSLFEQGKTSVPGEGTTTLEGEKVPRKRRGA